MKHKKTLKNKDLWSIGLRKERDAYIAILRSIDILSEQDILRLIKTNFGKSISRGLFYKIIRKKANGSHRKS